ncbi:hypothetical protein GQ53DRAFT_747316 [Thozetella sp. PMI_491]|nr:hypothetical protein GQ53DRAFT_747316 [Thozetella sp. PMI_491]
MSKSSKVPDAWDDDWEAQPDPAQQQAPAALEPKVPLTKKERWARHAETQRKLWEEAYTSLL